MTRIENSKGTKAVVISKDATGKFRAVYLQVYQGEDQVLQSKDFSNPVNAYKWAYKTLPV
jgi:hypothetical protein